MSYNRHHVKLHNIYYGKCVVITFKHIVTKCIWPQYVIHYVYIKTQNGILYDYYIVWVLDLIVYNSVHCNIDTYSFVSLLFFRFNIKLKYNFNFRKSAVWLRRLSDDLFF